MIGEPALAPRIVDMDNSDVSHASAIKRILKRFDPTANGLAKDFLLQKLTKMKGCGSKVPRSHLLLLLKEFGAMPSVTDGEIGIGLDSCVVPLRHEGLSLVQTTDFFYPLVDDPYIMGRITAANVLSDLYATGVSDCDNMLMLLGVSNELDDKSRNIVIGQFIRGFRDAATLADTEVRGGQTVKCPWLLLGGMATSVVTDSEKLLVDKAVVGDVLILTKPLGCQVAVNAYEWLQKEGEGARIKDYMLDRDKVVRAAQQAMEQMCRLNRTAAILARKYGAHACTDVTGFGILGHADNLAKEQKEKVTFMINALPLIQFVEEVSRAMNLGNGFNLFSGTSAETSGGLLVVLPPNVVDAFRKELEDTDGFPTFEVGCVTESIDPAKQNTAMLRPPNPEVVTVPSPIHRPFTPRVKPTMLNPNPPSPSNLE